MNGATMEAMRIRKTVESDGEVHLTGLPCHRGEKVEMILIIGTVERSSKRQLTARDLRQSGMVGLWSHRRDIGNSRTFARRLRQTAVDMRVPLHTFNTKHYSCIPGLRTVQPYKRRT